VNHAIKQETILGLHGQAENALMDENWRKRPSVSAKAIDLCRVRRRPG
jgi:hypothetical protein